MESRWCLTTMLASGRKGRGSGWVKEHTNMESRCYLTTRLASGRKVRGSERVKEHKHIQSKLYLTAMQLEHYHLLSIWSLLLGRGGFFCSFGQISP